MPKFLFEGELKSLSNDARVLYALFKDRHELSLKNQWVNENGEVYFLFKREDLCELLGCSKPTLRKAINQLRQAGLIDEERRGAMMPNRLYLYYMSQSSIDFFQSRVKKSFSHDCKDFSPNDTDLIKTNLSENQSYNRNKARKKSD